LKATRFFSSPIAVAAAISLFSVAAATLLPAQDSSQKPAEKTAERIQEKSHEKPEAKSAPKIPAQIELLETHIRFETDGGSRKEVHALVKINDELGARQFARLNFDFNCSFEQIEIPLVRITHPSGGVVDVLPGAITDTPNPAVVNAPAYQDVRVKSVRILGLEPGDSLEYRVITTVSHHPLAPDFWLDHTFDRTGVVSHEIFLIDAPAARLRFRINPDTPAVIEKSGEGDSSRVSYRWDLEQEKLKPRASGSGEDTEDLALTTYPSWSQLSNRIAKTEYTGFGTFIYQKADERGGPRYKRGSPESLYQLVSQKVATIDLPLELSLSAYRGAEQILESGYGTSEEKARLLSILMTQIGPPPQILMYGHGRPLETELPRPSLLAGAMLLMPIGTKQYFLDPSLEVAPFGVIPSKLRGLKSLNISETSADTNDCFTAIPVDLPFASLQRVHVQSSLSLEGGLTAKIKYVMRGDNELLLRVAFHQSPKEKWNEVAQLLALSDGFRGKVSNVTASDPYATHDPFGIEFEITQPKFLDWSKKPPRIPAILPLLGLPDPPTKTAPGTAATPINLGTPLDVEVSATVRLPAGTIAHIPTGTSVQRDFATYTSQYSAKDATLTATRHLNFILKEIPADRAADYNAFLRAVENDESQTFTLERGDTTPPAPKKP
jgi:hypothetical protein